MDIDGKAWKKVEDRQIPEFLGKLLVSFTVINDKTGKPHQKAGTAFLISSKHLLTAAHIITSKDWGDVTEGIFMLGNDTEVAGKFIQQSIHLPFQSGENHSIELDYAIVELDRDIDIASAKLPVLYNYAGARDAFGGKLIMGYPEYDGEPYYLFVTEKEYHESYLVTTESIVSGFSGSPFGQGRKVYGIAVAGDEWVGGIIVLITRDIDNWISGILGIYASSESDSDDDSDDEFYLSSNAETKSE